MNNTWWVKPDDLDERQKAVIDLSLDVSHLIVGPPGSGKTNLLLLRASQMVRSGKPNILILVFTRTLREFIATGGTQYAFGVDKIQTLNSWGMKFLRDHGVEATREEDFDKQRRARLAQIQKVIAQQRLSNMYEAIVLDETQDYLPEELEVFLKLGIVVFAAADSRQKIYATKNETAVDLHALFGGAVYILKHHYRNGHNICKIADELAKVWEDHEPLTATCNYNEKHNPSTVHEQKCIDLAAQVAAAVQVLQIQLKAYPDEQLGVLCPTRSTLKVIWEILSSSAVGKHAVLQSAEDGYAEFDSTKPICVCSVYSAKGLEFRAVHILDANNLKNSSLNRNIAYMAITRAKTSLSFYYSKALPGYLDSALSVGRPSVPKATLNQLFDGS